MTPRNGRVQLSAEELEVLVMLVWNKVKDLRALDLEDEKLGALFMKLNRAHNRVAARAHTA